MPDICATPIATGPQAGKIATGTNAGYSRHRVAGELACEACLAAHSEHVRTHQKRGPKPTKTPPPKRMVTETYRLSGSTPVRCRICGARGKANRALVGRARMIDGCRECR